MNDALDPSPPVMEVVSFLNAAIDLPKNDTFVSKPLGGNLYEISFNPRKKYTEGDDNLNQTVGSWLKQTTKLSDISSGCEVIADKVVKELGESAEFLEITPRLGNQLGPVLNQHSGWSWHVAAIKNGRVYDRLTGS